MTIDTSRLSSEVAHVLFLDVVGYSRELMEQQARLIHDLRQTVRATPEYARAAERRELIGLDTGDGMALVFFRDPLAPVQCASEIARALDNHPRLRLRMGIHSGPVLRVPDLNHKENVTGSGINMAQRVMNCGDAGHILLSDASAGFVRDFEAWAASLQDLGEYEVKHGARLHLYNLVVGAVGNPNPPSCMGKPTVPSDTTTAVSPVGRSQRRARSQDDKPIHSVSRLRMFLPSRVLVLLVLAVCISPVIYLLIQHLYFSPQMKKGYTFGTTNLAVGGKPLYISGKLVVGSHFTLTNLTGTVLAEGEVKPDKRDSAHPNPNKGVIAIPATVDNVRALLTVRRYSFMSFLSAALPKDQQAVDIGGNSDPAPPRVPKTAVE